MSRVATPFDKETVHTLYPKLTAATKSLNYNSESPQDSPIYGSSGMRADQVTEGLENVPRKGEARKEWRSARRGTSAWSPLPCS
jgi:hypothetical protein